MTALGTYRRNICTFTTSTVSLGLKLAAEELLWGEGCKIFCEDCLSRKIMEGNVFGD